MIALLACLLVAMTVAVWLSYATTIRTARLTAVDTDVGASPVLRIYSGSVPANVGASLGAAVLLAEGTLPATWVTEAAGVMTKAGTWTATGQAGAGGGTAGTFFRIWDNAGTTAKIQGTFGAAGEMIPDNNSIANGQTVTVTSFTITAGNV